MKTFLKTALLLMLFTSSLFTANAADKKSQWTKDMLEYKHEYIVKETGMTAAQKSQFLPLYEAMEKEIFTVHRNAREQAKQVKRKNNSASDNEYFNAAQAMNNVKAKEGEIENRYFQKFAKILSKKQLFLLKQAEIKFTRQMVANGKK